MIRNNDFSLEYINNLPCLLAHGQCAADRKKSTFLNETGVFIWNLLSDDIAIEDIFNKCYEYFEIPEDERPNARRSIQSYMDTLCYSGMVIDRDFYQKFDLKKHLKLNIAGLCLNLYGKSGLFDDSFKDFEDDSFSCSEDRIQNIYVYHIAPVFHENGELIMRDKEVTVIKTDDKYIITFPLWKYVEEVQISFDGTDVSIYVNDPENAKDEVFWAIRHAFLYFAGLHGLYALHSVSVEYDNKALMFSAGSGIGKSTHAAIWTRLYGTKQINGDLNLLGRNENGSYHVYGMPWCGTSGIYDKKTYDIIGIVLLRQDPKNSISHMKPEAKALASLNRIISPMWTQKMAEDVLNFTKGLSSAIPIWNYNCNMTDDAAACIKAEIDKTIR